MIGGLEKYPEATMEVRRATITERLKHRKSELEKQLAEVSAAVAALEKNPELQNLLDIVSRVA